MAEGNVYIEGIDPSIPQWSTEATLQQIKNILSKENALTSTVSKQIDNLAKGDANTLNVLRQTMGQQAKNNKATEELKDAVVKGNAQEQASINKQTGIFSSIKSFLQDSLRNDDIQLRRQELQHQKLVETLTKQNIGLGMTEDVAKRTAKQDAAIKHAQARGVNIEEPGLINSFGDAMLKLGQIGVAAEGVNAFVQQGFEDRFNLANEIRQSGLMAGFDTVQAGMLNMADMINKTGFTFGQAAEFTQKFAFAVGQRGVQASLEFADSMARPATEYEAGADMMRRFGMDFAQVANMSGIYLESLQNANMLGKLNDQQMRDGMDNFMEGVQATSNVLKVSLEDAAQMIAQRLQRDDVNALLALMDPDQRAQAQMGIAQIGLGQDSVIGEAILKRISAGDSGSFLREDVFQDLMSTGIGSELVPMVDQIGSLIESGATAEQIQDAMASLGPEFERIIAGATEADKAIIQQNPQLAKIVSEMSRMADNIQDANLGDVAETSQEKILGDADTAVVERAEIIREATVTIEKLMNTQMETFKNVQQGLNTANDNAIASLEKLGMSTAGLATLAIEQAGIIQIASRTLGTALVDVANAVVGTADTIINEFLEATGLDDTRIGQNFKNAGTVDETQELQEDAESKAMRSGRQALDDRKYLRFLDNDAESMFDEIMSVLTTNNPGDMSSQASDLASLLGFNDFNNTFEQNQQAFAAAIEAIRQSDVSQNADAADRLEKLIQAIGQLDGQYKDRFFRSDETTANMNRENVEDRKQLVGKIEDLIDALRNPQ